MVKTLTDNNFAKEVLQSSKPVLVDFWAPWCGPCRMVGPVVDVLAEEYSASIDVGKVNVDENRETAMQYGIRSIPTLIIFKDGQEVKRIIGAQSKPQLEQAIKSLQ